MQRRERLASRQRTIFVCARLVGKMKLKMKMTNRLNQSIGQLIIELELIYGRTTRDMTLQACDAPI